MAVWRGCPTNFFPPALFGGGFSPPFLFGVLPHTPPHDEIEPHALASQITLFSLFSTHRPFTRRHQPHIRFPHRGIPLQSFFSSLSSLSVFLTGTSLPSSILERGPAVKTTPKIHIFSLFLFLFSFKIALCSPFLTLPPDTLNGTTGFGTYTIIRTDTSFSGTVCDGQVSVEGTWDADSVYLERALLDSSDFVTHISYLPGDAVWSNAILLISSFCKNLIDVSVVLEEQGTPFPAGQIELFLNGLGESDPLCETSQYTLIRVEFYTGPLSGDFVIQPACIAVLWPGTVANLTSTSVASFGALSSMDPAPLYTSSNIVISGRTNLAGDVSADSVFIDGSFLGATLSVGSLTTRTLDADSGLITVTGNLAANKIGIGSPPPINLF